MDVFRAPTLPIRLGHEPRQLARDVRRRGENPQIARPLIDRPGPDLRLRQMIEDERLLRKPGHELRRHRQMARVDQDVVGQVELAQRCNPPAEGRTQQEPVVGLGLDDMPHAHQLRMRRRPREPHADVIGLQIDPPHDAGHERIPIRQIQQPTSLLFGLTHLNGNRSSNSSLLHLDAEIVGHEVPPQRAHRLVNPAVLARVVAPEVLVAVDAQRATSYVLRAHVLLVRRPTSNVLRAHVLRAGCPRAYRATPCVLRNVQCPHLRATSHVLGAHVPIVLRPACYETCKSSSPCYVLRAGCPRAYRATSCVLRNVQVLISCYVLRAGCPRAYRATSCVLRNVQCAHLRATSYVLGAHVRSTSHVSTKSTSARSTSNVSHVARGT